MKRGRRCGFTVSELAAVVVASVLLAALIVPAVLTPRRCCSSPQLKDSTQVRGIHQSMLLWAQGNKGRYPRPSEVDGEGATVAGPAESKDTTANIMSLLIYNGYIPPELCVSPAEANPAITVMSNYQYEKPTAAARPEMALWDPGFRADFTAAGGGNVSYGHLMPTGARLEDWRDTFAATRAVVGNRGPKVTGAAKGRGGEVSPALPASSLTYLIHGGKRTWEGNIAYNDNHVNFETRVDPEGSVYTDGAGKSWQDVLFLDEGDDPSGRNNFLGVFVGSGKGPGAYSSIWD